MHVTSAHLRAIFLPVALVAGLVGASGVSAAEDPTATTAATVAGTGSLAAQGNGHARLAGSYALTGSLDGGTITIRGLDRWSTVRVTGWRSRTRLGDGTLVYRFGDGAGRFLISGRTIATNLDSTSMRFTAAGHGRATLIGEGSYWVNGRGPLAWSDPAAEATF